MAQLDVRTLAQRVLRARAGSSNPYDALLLPRTASFQDVRAAYKRLILLHPDKNPGEDAAAEAFKIVAAAFEEIKAQAPDARPDALRPAYETLGGNRWAAFTAGAPAAPAPESWAAPAAKRPAPAAAAKWGRAPSDAHRLLKVPNLAADSVAGRRGSGEDARRRRSSGSGGEAAAGGEASPCAPDADGQHGVSAENFYGGGPTKKPAQKKQRRSDDGNGGDGSGDGGTSPGPSVWRYGQGGGSLWFNSARLNPLAHLLRNPEAAVAPAAAAAPAPTDSPAAAPSPDRPRARKVSKVIIDSNSEGDAREAGRGAPDGSGSDSDGWDSGSEEEAEAEEGAGGEARERENEGKTRALLKLLAAQQRDGARRGVAAAARARAASARRAAGRRGRARTRQTRLKLKPVTAR